MSYPVIRENKVVCADRYMEVDIFNTTTAPAASRRSRKTNPSKYGQQKINLKNSVRYFHLKAVENFDEHDYYVTLTYTVDMRPETYFQAISDRQSFIDRLTKKCRRRGLPKPKWMGVIEHTEHDDGRKGIPWHHHMLLSCQLPVAEIKEAWLRDKDLIGIAKIDTLVFLDDRIEDLCEYMCKDPVGKRKWSCSRGLREPDFRPPNHERYKKRRFEKEVKEGRFYDKIYLRSLYPGWEPIDTEAVYTDGYGWAVYIKLRRRRNEAKDHCG